MFNRISDGLTEGRRRYGSRMNEKKNDVRLCPECKKEFTDGASLIGHLIISHDYDHTKAVKRVDSMENAGRDLAEYTKCASCSHEKALHTEGNGTCYSCGCSDFKPSLTNQDGISKKERDLAIGKPIPSKSGDDGIENDSALDCKYCGHRPSSHGQDGGPCSICDCEGYAKSAANADGKLIVAGGKSKEVAFVDCQTCDAGIEESRIQDHLKDGHTVEKVMKNDADDDPAKEGETAAMYENQHRKGRHEGKPQKGCPMCEMQNDTTLGYDYATTTTTLAPGSTCAECGHTIGQKFYDTGCPCRCHTERVNTGGPHGCPSCGSHQYEIAEGGNDTVRCLDCGNVSNLEMWNTMCDICRKEEGAGLEEHLVTRHGLETDVAAVVAADMESGRG